MRAPSKEPSATPARRAHAPPRRGAQAGRIYGIGFAAVVEPAMSNMGYLSTLMTAAAREKSGPKSGAVSMATVNIDPLGAVTVTCRRHGARPEPRDGAGRDRRRTARAQGDDIEVVLEMDTAKDQWSIAAGTYSSRFASGTAVAAHMAAVQMRDKLKGIAAKQLMFCPTMSSLPAARSGAAPIPTMRSPFGRVAGTSHWSPLLLPESMAPALSETGIWSPQELEAPSRDDRINTSLTYGFIFDMCGIEIDPLTYAVRVDRYVSMHDADAS